MLLINGSNLEDYKCGYDNEQIDTNLKFKFGLVFDTEFLKTFYEVEFRMSVGF